MEKKWIWNDVYEILQEKLTKDSFFTFFQEYWKDWLGENRDLFLNRIKKMSEKSNFMENLLSPIQKISKNNFKKNNYSHICFAFPEKTFGIILIIQNECWIFFYLKNEMYMCFSTPINKEYDFFLTLSNWYFFYEEHYKKKTFCFYCYFFQGLYYILKSSGGMEDKILKEIELTFFELYKKMDHQNFKKCFTNIILEFQNKN